MQKKRPYRMIERAKSQEETRLRIVEAAMHLHEEIGPRSTTISAIAERAGVQRLTVYRHFSDEAAVFQACTAHWLSLNPPPDPQSWAEITEPFERTKAALEAFYRYYAATRRMWTAAHRDVAEVQALQGPMEEFAGFLASVANDLSARFGATGKARERVEATISHAIAFPAWSDLDGKMPDAEKIALIGRWLCGALDPD